MYSVCQCIVAFTVERQIAFRVEAHTPAEIHHGAHVQIVEPVPAWRLTAALVGFTQNDVVEGGTVAPNLQILRLLAAAGDKIGQRIEGFSDGLCLVTGDRRSGLAALFQPPFDGIAIGNGAGGQFACQIYRGIKLRA